MQFLHFKYLYIIKYENQESLSIRILKKGEHNMQIALPNELKKWCYYDVKIFSWRLKKDAPKEIIEKFHKHEERSLKRYNMKG